MIYLMESTPNTEATTFITIKILHEEINIYNISKAKEFGN